MSGQELSRLRNKVRKLCTPWLRNDTSAPIPERPDMWFASGAAWERLLFEFWSAKAALAFSGRWAQMITGR